MNIDWTARFPGLHKLEPSIRNALIETSKIVKLPNGTHIFEPGQSPANYLLLLHGTRRFVFMAFSVRITNLFKIIDEVAFSRMTSAWRRNFSI